MTTMLEKMAEAIWNACDDWGPFSDALPSERATFANTVARAALLAIREPGHDQVMAGHRAGLGNIREAWQEMIDFVINEKPE